MKEPECMTPLLRQFLNPMTTDQFLEIVQDRGLRFVLLGGELYLEGPVSEITPALTDVIKYHRDEITRRLKERPREE